MDASFSEPLPLITLTRSLSIRPLLHTDAPTILQYTNNPLIARNMLDTWPVPYTLDSAHNFISLVRDTSRWRSIRVSAFPVSSSTTTTTTTASSDDTTTASSSTSAAKAISAITEIKAPVNWALALNGEVIGGIGITFLTDIRHRVASIGYWIGEPQWGKGYTTEFVRGFVQWVWEAYSPEVLDKLEAGVYGWNTASMGVLRKCGFVEEGRYRGGVWKMGFRTDLVVFGLLREDLVDGGDGERGPHA